MERLLNTREACMMLGINKQKLYSLIFEGSLGECVCENGRYYLTPAGVRAYREKRVGKLNRLTTQGLAQLLGVATTRISYLLGGVVVQRDELGRIIYTDEVVGILQQKLKDEQERKAKRRAELDELERGRAERRAERKERQEMEEIIRRAKAEAKRREELGLGEGIPAAREQVPTLSYDQTVGLDLFFKKYPQMAADRAAIEERVLDGDITVTQLRQQAKEMGLVASE